MKRFTVKSTDGQNVLVTASSAEDFDLLNEMSNRPPALPLPSLKFENDSFVPSVPAEQVLNGITPLPLPVINFFEKTNAKKSPAR